VTQAPESPRPPDLTRRTLTPFGYTIVAIVPILIAAVGFTILHFNYNPEDVVTGTRVPLTTSDWRTGDTAGSTPITGTLSLGPDGCVHLMGTDGTDEPVVWPLDFEATYDTASDGTQELKLYDTDRYIAARGGDTVQMTGIVRDIGQYANQDCAPPAGTQAAFVESKVTVTSQG
jgi:hypothetical protein